MVKFQVFPLSALDISPPVALYCQAPLCLKLGSALLRVIEISSQAINILLGSYSIFKKSVRNLRGLPCAGAGEHVPAAHSIEM